VKIATPAILVGHDVAVARGNRISRSGDWNFEQWSCPRVADFTPIEPGMRDYDLSASD
jgi:hypothetical protein